MLPTRFNLLRRNLSTVVDACSKTTLSKFPGAQTSFTSILNLNIPTSKRECYRVLDENGKFVDKKYKLKINLDQLQDMYKTMIKLMAMDQIFYDAQRQGRISFYMQNFGEEAVQIGSASAITMDDVIFAQYREAGVFLWRGFDIRKMAHQCFSNCKDLGKGRQMPVHYGSLNINLQTISSPLCTQLPQATGAAYALKMSKSGNVVICYFGEGAASEGDFHPALNFAATLDCPVIFFCRNNGFAISTPSSEQYKGDGIVSRAEGYGIRSIRVDGNDILAVNEATAYARDYAVKNNKPVLIEAMCYRGGHHSTSDDSTRYRKPSEIQYWAETDNPVLRTRLFLEANGVWNTEKEIAARETAKKEVMEAFNSAESLKKPSIDELFTDEIPILTKQKEELRQHLQKYGEHYGLNEYESGDFVKSL